MQVVVPAAGRGLRFLSEGYKGPKPLVSVFGKPIIRWSTDGLRGVDNARFIFLVLQEHIDQFDIDRRLQELYGSCAVIPVAGVTEGAAATVLLAKPYLDPKEEFLIVNCDNLFSIDFQHVKKQLTDEDDGVIFYFASNYDRWSYVQADGRGLAVRIAEKEVISDKATVGCYYFRRAELFVDAAEYMIKNNIRTKGEFYVSPSYNILIERGSRIRVMPVDFHFSLGTPEELASFKEIFSAIGQRLPVSG